MYDLNQVKKVYSFLGKSAWFYKLSIFSFGYEIYLRKKTMEFAHLRQGDRILEIACGPGNNFKYILKKIGKKGKLVAVDYIKEMIDNCKKLKKRKKWDNLTLIQADAAKLKLKTNSFDAIISIIGLSAIPDHMSTLKNCKTFLKKGGKLVVLDGKEFNYALFNPLLKLLRYKKTYQKKNLIKDIKKIFGNVRVKEYIGGSSFIAVAKKQNI